MTQKKKSFQKLSTASRGGDSLDQLRTLQAMLAKIIDAGDADPKEMIAYMVQYRMVTNDINRIERELNEEQDAIKMSDGNDDVQDVIVNPVTELRKKREQRERKIS